ncbi:glycosyltransferase [Aestuariicoccus sp. MJ-SS9]|uniref:glycosyltransferase n=1 Tax=Aestuariicoccus sp. MJ-SS9 TaxID=3079855 RepID=UPI002912687F|nr:glycosyltransferase [Aestuariicoccus sp. MJ-SS9]MDU8914057.1 glycosyltransferase [Aestuariicoccus sp. MJ-SS9]
MSAPVAILMAVYNGGALLRDQLSSIAAQDHADWRLLASDDGSSDNSRAVLEAFAAEGHDVTVLDGSGQGGCANFMSLVARMGDHAAPESWLAFSDQDDVWLPDRLSRGIAALDGIEGPALYCSRTWVTDADLRGRRLSAARPRAPSFANALVQNVVAGNTILLNAEAARLAQAAVHEAGRVVVHDWWIYQLITGAGGRVVHDDAPTLLYRQHGANQIGANDAWRARARRIRQLLRGDFAQWNAVNIAALRASAHRFTPENRTLLEDFAAMRGLPFARRLAAFARLPVYRQSVPAQAALWLAALLGRL